MKKELFRLGDEVICKIPAGGINGIKTGHIGVICDWKWYHKQQHLLLHNTQDNRYYRASRFEKTKNNNHRSKK